MVQKKYILFFAILGLLIGLFLGYQFGLYNGYVLSTKQPEKHGVTFFTLSGSMIMSNVTVKAPIGFEISKDCVYWADSQTYTPLTGTLTGAIVYMRYISDTTVHVPFDSAIEVINKGDIQELRLKHKK